MPGMHEAVEGGLVDPVDPQTSGPGLQVVGQLSVPAVTAQRMIARAVGCSRRHLCLLWPNRQSGQLLAPGGDGGLGQPGLAVGLPTVVSLRRPGWTDAAAPPVSPLIGASAARCDV